MMFRPAMPVKRVVGSAGLRTPVKALCHCETLRLTDHAVGATNAFSRGPLSSAFQPFIASVGERPVFSHSGRLESVESRCGAVTLG
jgi:hypothetical protein